MIPFDLKSNSSIAQGQGTTVERLLNVPGNEKYKDNPDLIHPGDKLNTVTLETGNQQNQAPSQSEADPSSGQDTQNSQNIAS